MRAAEGVGPYESGEQHNRGIVLDAESGRSPSSPSSVRTGGSFPRWGKHSGENAEKQGFSVFLFPE